MQGRAHLFCPPFSVPVLLRHGFFRPALSLAPLCTDSAERLADAPFFLAHLLVALRVRHSQTHQQQAQVLGISPDTVTALALCRMPRDQNDVAQIAGRFRMDGERLGNRLGIG